MNWGIKLLDAAPETPVNEYGVWIVIGCMALVIVAVLLYNMYKKK